MLKYKNRSIEELYQLYFNLTQQVKRVERAINKKMQEKEQIVKQIDRNTKAKGELQTKFEIFRDNYLSLASKRNPSFTLEMLAKQFNHKIPKENQLAPHEYLEEIIHDLIQYGLVHPPDRGQYHLAVEDFLYES